MCLRGNGFLLLTEICLLSGILSKNDLVTTCQVVLSHGHCDEVTLQRYTSNYLSPFEILELWI